MRRELVSVLMPVYNVEKFVYAAVKSILDQTYREIELIIVDDCSADSTWSVLQELAKNDSRLVLLQNDVNSKIVFSLNSALAIAKGSYIARMDGDDIAHIERIERQYNYLCEHSGVSLVGVSTISIDENGNEFARQELISDPILIEKCLNLTSLVSHNWLCRREVYDVLGGYRELAPVEDYDFLLRAYAAGYRFTNLPFFGMKIRYRSGNTATTAGLEQIKAFNYVTRLYKERRQNGYDSYSKDAFSRFVQSSEWRRRLHLRSAEWLRYAFDARSKRNWFKCIFFGVGSVVISRYQLYVIARRQLMHIYKRIYT